MFLTEEGERRLREMLWRRLEAERVKARGEVSRAFIWAVGRSEERRRVMQPVPVQASRMLISPSFLVSGGIEGCKVPEARSVAKCVV